MDCFGRGANGSRAKTLTSQWMRHLLFASRILALLVLLVYMPVLVAVGMLILSTSDGPAFVKKAYRRPSHSDKVVYLYEFRTECWRTWRQTPIGGIIRMMDLHRLPRLANVLTGEVHVGERVEAICA